MLLNSELIIVKKNYELIRIIYYLKSCQIFKTRTLPNSSKYDGYRYLFSNNPTTWDVMLQISTID